MGVLKRIEHLAKHTADRAVRRWAASAPSAPSAPPRRILYIRYGQLGDMVLTLPVLRATRAALPGVRIDVLCDRRNVAPLTDSGLVDQIELFDKRPVAIAKLVRRLRRQHYDYVCNLVAYPSFTFGLIARAAGAHAVRAGGDQGRYAYFYNRDIELPDKRAQHMLDRLFDLARDLTSNSGRTPVTPWVEYPTAVGAAAQQLLADTRHELGITAHSPLALVNLSAGLPRREWPLDRYTELLATSIPRHLGDIRGWAVLTDPSHPERARQLCISLAGLPIQPLAPHPDFRVIMECVRRAALVLTPDTSIAHVASAMGTPAVVLMIGENATTWAPIGTHHRLAVSDDPRVLTDLPVESVGAALDSLIKSDARRADSV